MTPFSPLPFFSLFLSTALSVFCCCCFFVWFLIFDFFWSFLFLAFFVLFRFWLFCFFCFLLLLLLFGCFFVVVFLLLRDVPFFLLLFRGGGGGGGAARFLFILVFPPSTHQTWCLRLVVLFLPMWWGATARKLGWCRYRGHWRSGPRHLSPWSRVCAQEWHRKDSHSHIHSHPPMLTPNLTKSETINSPNMTPAISCPLPVQSWR